MKMKLSALLILIAGSFTANASEINYDLNETFANGYSYEGVIAIDVAAKAWDEVSGAFFDTAHNDIGDSTGQYWGHLTGLSYYVVGENINTILNPAGAYSAYLEVSVNFNTASPSIDYRSFNIPLPYGGITSATLTSTVIPPASVPLPGAAWLMMSSLPLFGALVRRKTKSA
jgi:hypothetical protein